MRFQMVLFSDLTWYPLCCWCLLHCLVKFPLVGFSRGTSLLSSSFIVVSSSCKCMQNCFHSLSVKSLPCSPFSFVVNFSWSCFYCSWSCFYCWSCRPCCVLLTAVVTLLLGSVDEGKGRGSSSARGRRGSVWEWSSGGSSGGSSDTTASVRYNWRLQAASRAAKGFLSSLF